MLLLPEFSNLGLTAVTEPLFIANWLAQAGVFEWRTISVDGEPVRASNGAVVAVEGDLALAADCASVFVLASFEPARAARNRVVVRWLKRLGRRGVELAGIENGSLVLAAAGLLDEHAAAVHWDNLAGFQELFPKIRIAPTLYSFSRNRVTCAGAAAILDMMVAWIARHVDVETSAEVARHLLLSGRKGPDEAGADEPGPAAPGVTQPGMARSDAVRLVARARTLMQSHVDDPLSCEALARRLDISLRQLERHFKQVWRHTLHTEYMQVRVEKAHQYLQQTDLSVTEVGALTGFSSVEYFSKVYRRMFGVLPSTDRRQSTDAPVFRSRRQAPSR